jgi:hypothetical protein
VQHIASLGALYPEAKFNHVIRAGRDSAASFQRRWKRTPDLTIYRWKKVIREGRRQASTLAEGRYLEVHYEQLTTDTEHWLRAICGFLDEPFDTAILESSQPYLAGRDDDEDGDDEPKSKTLVPNSGKWREQFSSAEIQSLESIAGSALQECGYETAQADGDRDLTRGERRMLSLRDNAVQFGREVQMKLRGQIERPWRVILSRPLVSLRQNRHNQY